MGSECGCGGGGVGGWEGWAGGQGGHGQRVLANHLAHQAPACTAHHPNPLPPNPPTWSRPSTRVGPIGSQQPRRAGPYPVPPAWPDGASASLDDVTVYGGTARDRRKNPPAEGTPNVILTGRVVMGSVNIRGPRKSKVPVPPLLRRR